MRFDAEGNPIYFCCDNMTQLWFHEVVQVNNGSVLLCYEDRKLVMRYCPFCGSQMVFTERERDGDYMVAMSKTMWADHVQLADAMGKLKIELHRVLWDILRPITSRITWIKWIGRP